MKLRHFSSKTNILYTNQDTPLPFDSSLVNRKFFNIPYTTLSFSQKLSIHLPHEGEGPFPVIAGINRGAFLGWDKSDKNVAPMPNGRIENPLHTVSPFESNEDIDNRSIH